MVSACYALVFSYSLYELLSLVSIAAAAAVSLLVIICDRLAVLCFCGRWLLIVLYFPQLGRTKRYGSLCIDLASPSSKHVKAVWVLPAVPSPQ